MASELKLEQTTVQRIDSNVARFGSLWNQNDIAALSERELLAQAPAAVLAHTTFVSDSTSLNDRQLVQQGVLPAANNLLDSLKQAQHKNKLAQDVDLPIMPTFVPRAEDLNLMQETTMRAVEIAQKVVANWSSEHPIAGQEEALMNATTQSNPRAWEDTRSGFRQLSKSPVQLMKAYVRNELAFYDDNDWMDDLAAGTGHLRDKTATLGVSQISPKGVAEFSHRYPQLKSFLESRGYGAGDEASALLDPTCAPMIVAAKTASIVDDLANHGIKEPTAAQLAYAYNPDVYSYSNGHGGREYKTLYQAQIKLSNVFHWDQHKEYYADKPEVIEASHHVKNVLSWVKNAATSEK